MMFGRPSRKLKRVLVVEDEPLVAFDNEHFLGSSGFEVVATVDSVAEALRVIEQGDSDLVLTDISLRGDGSGVDVARAAHARGVTVLLVTGDCPPEAEAYAIGCLAKPYSQTALLRAIQAIEAKLAGRRIGRVPPGLTFFER